MANIIKVTVVAMVFRDMVMENKNMENPDTVKVTVTRTLLTVTVMVMGTIKQLPEFTTKNFY